MCMFCDHTSKSTELYSHTNDSSNNNNNNHINNNINNDNIASLLLINRSRVHFILSEQAEWPSPNRIVCCNHTYSSAQHELEKATAGVCFICREIKILLF